MSLPNLYNATQDYFNYCNDVINFLRQNEWIYNFTNTDVLVENVFNKLPRQWREHLEKLSSQELNEIPFGLYKETWPESLKKFIKTVINLKPNYHTIQFDKNEIKLPNNFSRGLNPKKQHEIINLSKFIHDKCKKHQITTIIDVGAGLGYVSHLLYENYGYKILAIESDLTRFQSALKRQNKYYPNSKNHVRFVHHYVNENSVDDINKQLQQWLGENFNENVCLIGLHACADLTITALNIFLTLDYIKLNIIMPCCYHKLQLMANNSDNDNIEKNINQTNLMKHCPEYFKNFPLSLMLKKIYEENEAWMFLRRPFLRVACQSSASVWRKMSADEHKQHSICHMRRAVLQLFVTEENYALVKLKRKCMNRLTSSNCDFEMYLKQLDNGFYLVPHITTNSTNPGIIIKDYMGYDNRNDDLKFMSPKIRERLVKLWEQYEKDCDLIEILTCFQNSIQGVCENLILLDRVMYLEEKRINSTVEKVTDDYVSPRCYALIAFKDVC